MRHEELRTPLQGSWMLSPGDISRSHTSSQVPAEIKGAESGKIQPRASGSASPRFVISQSWVASLVSHAGPPRKRRQRGNAAGVAVEAGQPRKDKARLTLPTPKMGTRETKCVWCH